MNDFVENPIVRGIGVLLALPVIMFIVVPAMMVRIIVKSFLEDTGFLDPGPDLVDGSPSYHQRQRDKRQVRQVAAVRPTVEQRAKARADANRERILKRRRANGENV